MGDNQSPIFTIQSSGWPENSSNAAHWIFGFFFTLFLLTPVLMWRYKNIFASAVFVMLAIFVGLLWGGVYVGAKKSKLAFEKIATGPYTIKVYPDYVEFPLSSWRGLARGEQGRSFLALAGALAEKGGYIRLERRKIVEVEFREPTRYTGMAEELYMRLIDPAVEINLRIPGLLPEDVKRLNQWREQRVIPDSH
jgi:hypothetical protein